MGDMQARFQEVDNNIQGQVNVERMQYTRFLSTCSGFCWAWRVVWPGKKTVVPFSAFPAWQPIQPGTWRTLLHDYDSVHKALQ